jgi:predicted extracellular nuclease
MDINDSGNDSALAIDDLSVTWLSVTPNTNAPSITRQPVNATNYEGGNVQFNVMAEGKAPLSYQWYITNATQSGPLNGATDTTLSLAGVGLANAGTYWVVVSNDVGTVISSNVTLTVRPPVVTNIAYLRSLLDANYDLTDTTTLYQVTGICTTSGALTSGSTCSFYLQDSSGRGINVFHRLSYAVPVLGDQVRVTASLLNYNGEMELAPVPTNPYHNLEVLSSGNALPAPQYLNLAATTNANLAVMEAFDGNYVIVSNVFLVTADTTFAVSSNNYVTLSNLLGQTLLLFNPSVAANPQGQSIPAFCTSIRGVVAQYDSSSPYTSGYELLLDLYANLEPGTPPTNQPTPIPLGIGLSGGNAVLNWADPAFSLQSATTVTGAFGTVTGATSPYTNTSGESKFFRLIQ